MNEGLEQKRREHANWVLGNTLQGGNHDRTELFEIGGDTWLLSAEFTQRMLNYPSYMPLRFKRAGDKKETFLYAPMELLDSSDDVEKYPYPAELLEPRGPEETPEHYVVRVAAFWGQLEALVALYATRMRSCPDKRARSMHADQFMRFFACLWMRD